MGEVIDRKKFVVWNTELKANTVRTLEGARQYAKEVTASRGTPTYILEVIEVASRSIPPVVVTPFVPTT